MSTAARKARKRAGIKFERTPKERTVTYRDRSRPLIRFPWKNPAELYRQLHPRETPAASTTDN